ncbi:glyoxalase III HchA [Pseudomonas aeruginosa]|uniref:glyoxalase III HchA n=1 Tax=Pseudomonas aeruginosa TaxID=287 RepID=UPI000EB4D737|nr:glyoxalase III HchA [Pseudomonas aeruginosa]MCT4933006.1 protein deglycase HchA [Pseudomonas aeruginosa]MDG3817963.1 protein deglycase HchA [Pseudomonas aeruginosa]MEB6162764.1 protein deglycase HchA [Pseudomonas aeruginosa]QTQ99825.1 protein deglycase HchA [Pseudomonas aeruginosa]RUE07979.1 protein deglycase HchA [Pseudomonas aeruginosa]
MSNERDTSRTPTPDHAEHNAFFPSPYSLSQYTSAKTDFDGADYPTPYKGGKKVLMIGTDERYILMQNGSMFSTGNHPVEMLLPMYHLDKAGFEFDVATLSGNPVKLEMWAMPGEDEAVKSIYAKYLPKLKAPQKLADLLEQAVADDSPYAAVFVPGGHGVLAGIPHSREVKRLLDAFLAKDRYIITLCHGPACLLAPAVDEKPEDYPFKGYEICVFPDALDTGANLEIGYMPGPLPWLVGENLQKLGVKILNKGITGQVHRDRKLLTGDSPLASNNLGKLAAKTLLEAFAR